MQPAASEELSCRPSFTQSIRSKRGAAGDENKRTQEGVKITNRSAETFDGDKALVWILFVILMY